MLPFVFILVTKLEQLKRWCSMTDKVEEELSLDDEPLDEVPTKLNSTIKKAPVYYDDDVSYSAFDSGSPFSTSVSNPTTS